MAKTKTQSPAAKARGANLAKARAAKAGSFAKPITSEEAELPAVVELSKDATSPEQAPPQDTPAEFKYIGDDGGRWIFERRSDKRVVTVDKPAELPAANPGEKMVRLMAHGYRVTDDVIAICRK